MKRSTIYKAGLVATMIISLLGMIGSSRIMFQDLSYLIFMISDIVGFISMIYVYKHLK